MQQGAEGIMRNVAKRLFMGEVGQCLMSWKWRHVEAKNQMQAERIMKRVGGRWRQREVVEAVGRWRESQLVAKMQEQGEMILKRVGGRLRQKDVAMALGEWQRNCRSNTQETVSDRGREKGGLLGDREGQGDEGDHVIWEYG